jgi:uncharacterized protein
MIQPPTRVIYLHGFASSPLSRKAQFFRQRFEALGIRVSVPDLVSGDFRDLTITGQLAVVEQLTKGEEACLLIGSSMGGYLAALAAARFSGIAGTILLAPAFSFYHLWLAGMTEAQHAAWRREGRISVFHYGLGRDTDLGYGLLEDAKQYEGFPAVRQPTLIVHGTNDSVVSSKVSEEFVRRNSHARLVLVPSGHELTDVLEGIWQETQAFVRQLAVTV